LHVGKGETDIGADVGPEHVLGLDIEAIAAINLELAVDRRGFAGRVLEGHGVGAGPDVHQVTTEDPAKFSILRRSIGDANELQRHQSNADRKCILELLVLEVIHPDSPFLFLDSWIRM
ncbi:MAG: hypothetical protein WBO74_16200, partial [Thermoanaerobaculia bacterium]